MKNHTERLRAERALLQDMLKRTRFDPSECIMAAQQLLLRMDPDADPKRYALVQGVASMDPSEIRPNTRHGNAAYMAVIIAHMYGYLAPWMDLPEAQTPEEITGKEKHAINVASWAVRGATVERLKDAIGVSIPTWYAWGDYTRTARPGRDRLERIADWLDSQAEIFTRAAKWVRHVSRMARPVKRGRPAKQQHAEAGL